MVVDVNGREAVQPVLVIANNGVINCRGISPTFYASPIINAIATHVKILEIKFTQVPTLSNNLVYLLVKKCQRLINLVIDNAVLDPDFPSIDILVNSLQTVVFCRTGFLCSKVDWIYSYLAEHITVRVDDSCLFHVRQVA